MKVKNLLTVFCLSLMASTAFDANAIQTQSSKPSLVKRMGSGIKNTANKVGNEIKKVGTTIKQKVTPVPASLISACNQAASSKVEAFEADYPELASAIDTQAMTKSASSKCSTDAKKHLNGQPVSGTGIFNPQDTTFSEAIEVVESKKTTSKSCNSAELIKLRAENANLKRQLSNSDDEDISQMPASKKRRVSQVLETSAPIAEPVSAPIVVTPPPAPAVEVASAPVEETPAPVETNRRRR